MSRVDRRVGCGTLALTLCTLVPSTWAVPAERQVIAPGNEALVGAMLGQGAALPDGCALDDASIERTFVSARYHCREGGAVIVELRHPDDAPAAALRTAAFAVVPRSTVPTELLAALRARIAALEAGWHWTTVSAGATPSPDPTPMPAGPGYSPEQSRAFAAAAAAYGAGKFQDALAAFRALARSQPLPGVVPMLTASLVRAGLDRAHVARWQAEADAAPDDGVAALVAGLGTFYCGALRGRTRDEKSELYRRALPYLERSAAIYGSEPRVTAARALIHFRLGEEATATPMIDQAFAAAGADPDVARAHAEIHHEGVAGSFDPLAGPPSPPARTASTSAPPSRLPALAALLLAGLAAAAALVVRIRRRRAT